MLINEQETGINLENIRNGHDRFSLHVLTVTMQKILVKSMEYKITDKFVI